MKKVVSLLLILCFLFLTLIACGETEETQASETESSSEESKPLSGTLEETDEYNQNLFVSAVPVDELDFDGETITILMRDGEDICREWGKEVIGDDPLDQAIDTRNKEVAEALNVVINLKQELPGGFDKYLETSNKIIKDDVDLDLHEIDMIAAFAYAATNTTVREYLADLSNKDVFPWFDFTLPCWNQSLVKNIIVNNRLYVVAGDLNLSMFDSTMMIWCNKTLYNNLKNDDDPDIQDLALSENGWCYTDLYRWAQYYEDTPNTPENCQNIIGYSMTKQHYDSCLPAWNIQLIKTEPDGTHSFNIKGNQYAEDCLESLRDLLNQQGTVTACTCGRQDGLGLMGHFVEGTMIFCLGNLYASNDINLKIRDMSDEYCILPLPKYQEGQEYGTISQMGFNLMSVVDHYESSVPTKGEAVSAYFQYATEKSYTDVRGYYFEKIVRAKYFGIDDSTGTVTKSQQLFDIILNSVAFDIATIYSPVINDITWLWKDLIELDGTLENAFKSNTNSGGGSGGPRTEAQYEAALDAFDAWMFS